MYESIQGALVRRDPAVATVRTGGLAYQVHIPLSTYEALPAAGAEVTLLLHLVVREDEWRLYGFATDEERGIFRALTRVNGVGPVLALSMLSGFSPAEFRSAVAQEDVRGLTRAKGVGKKTAERIVVELRDLWKGEAPRRRPGLRPLRPAERSRTPSARWSPSASTAQRRARGSRSSWRAPRGRPPIRRR